MWLTQQIIDKPSANSVLLDHSIDGLLNFFDDKENCTVTEFDSQASNQILTSTPNSKSAFIHVEESPLQEHEKGLDNEGVSFEIFEDSEVAIPEQPIESLEEIEGDENYESDIEIISSSSKNEAIAFVSTADTMESISRGEDEENEESEENEASEASEEIEGIEEIEESGEIKHYDSSTNESFQKSTEALVKSSNLLDNEVLFFGSSEVLSDTSNNGHIDSMSIPNSESATFLPINEEALNVENQQPFELENGVSSSLDDPKIPTNDLTNIQPPTLNGLEPVSNDLEECMDDGSVLNESSPEAEHCNTSTVGNTIEAEVEKPSEISSEKPVIDFGPISILNRGVTFSFGERFVAVPEVVPCVSPSTVEASIENIDEQSATSPSNMELLAERRSIPSSPSIEKSLEDGPNSAPPLLSGTTFSTFSAAPVPNVGFSFGEFFYDTKRLPGTSTNKKHVETGLFGSFGSSVWSELSDKNPNPARPPSLLNFAVKDLNLPLTTDARDRTGLEGSAIHGTNDNNNLRTFLDIHEPKPSKYSQNEAPTSELKTSAFSGIEKRANAMAPAPSEHVEQNTNALEEAPASGNKSLISGLVTVPVSKSEKLGSLSENEKKSMRDSVEDPKANEASSSIILQPIASRVHVAQSYDDTDIFESSQFDDLSDLAQNAFEFLGGSLEDKVIQIEEHDTTTTKPTSAGKPIRKSDVNREAMMCDKEDGIISQVPPLIETIHETGKTNTYSEKNSDSISENLKLDTLAARTLQDPESGDLDGKDASPELREDYHETIHDALAELDGDIFDSVSYVQPHSPNLNQATLTGPSILPKQTESTSQKRVDTRAESPLEEDDSEASLDQTSILSDLAQNAFELLGGESILNESPLLRFGETVDQDSNTKTSQHEQEHLTLIEKEINTTTQNKVSDELSEETLDGVFDNSGDEESLLAGLAQDAFEKLGGGGL